MAEIKIEVDNDLLEKNEYNRSSKRIKLEIKEEEIDEITIKEELPSSSNFQNSSKLDDLCTSVPSTSENVNSNDPRFKVFTKMCEDLPRLLRKVHKHLGDLNGDSEISQDRLNRMIEDEYLAGFDKETKEEYRCWFDEEGWQEVIQSQAHNFFESLTKIDPATGLKVEYFQKVKKKAQNNLTYALCIVCNKRKNRKRMKLVPTSIERKNEYIKILGPEIAAKMDRNSRICLTHFPKNEYVPYKHVLPTKIGVELTVEEEPVHEISQPSPNESRLEVLAKMRNELPNKLREICDDMKVVEIPRKHLDTLIETKFLTGMSELQKEQCRRWFTTVPWKTSIQEQINVYFENVKRKNAKTGIMVDYVRKPISMANQPVTVASDISDYRQKRNEVLMRMREGLEETVRNIFENMTGYEFPRNQFYRIMTDKFMIGFTEEEKSRYQRWFHEPAWRSFILQHVYFYFEEIGKKNTERGKGVIFVLRKRLKSTLSTFSVPSNTYHILLKNNGENNCNKLLSSSDIALRTFIKLMSENKSEEEIDEMLHRRISMIDEMSKMLEEHFCLVFMASRKPMIVRNKNMDFDNKKRMNFWVVGHYGADEDTCLFHNAMEFYKYFFHAKYTLTPCHKFSDFVNDITKHTTDYYYIHCPKDYIKEGPVLFENALNKFLELATIKLAGMARIDPRPDYMPEIEGIYNIPRYETIKSTVQKMCTEMTSEVIKNTDFEEQFKANVSHYWKMNNFSDPKILFSDLQNVFENMIATYFISEEDCYKKV